MYKFFVLAFICLLSAILLFRRYNNGMGAPLGSFRKKILYILALIFFVAFIILLNKGYYYSDIQHHKQLISELQIAQSELIDIYSSNNQISNDELIVKRKEITELANRGIKDSIDMDTLLQISEFITRYYVLEDEMNQRKDSLSVVLQKKLLI